MDDRSLGPDWDEPPDSEFGRLFNQPAEAIGLGDCCHQRDHRSHQGLARQAFTNSHPGRVPLFPRDFCDDLLAFTVKQRNAVSDRLSEHAQHVSGFVPGNLDEIRIKSLGHIKPVHDSSFADSVEFHTLPTLDSTLPDNRADYSDRCRQTPGSCSLNSIATLTAFGNAMPGRQRTAQINQDGTLNIVRQLPSFEEALARLLFLVEYRRPCGVVLGHAGSGKSALIEVVRQELSTSCCTPIVVDLQTLTATAVPRTLAVGMGLSPTSQDSPDSLWQAIEDRTEGAMSAGMSYVPLFDHLEQADADTLAAINCCCHLFARTQNTVLMSGRPPLPLELSMLVRSLCDLRIELPLWSTEETAQFVTQVQQVQLGPQFSESALSAIHLCAGGRLRDTQQVLRLANFAADAQDLETIDAEFIESVTSEIWRPATQLHDAPAVKPTTLELAAFSK